MPGHHPIVYLLGLFGLVPFVSAAFVLALNLDHAEFALRAVNIYAFGIICFLCGSWWGMGLHQGSRIAAILSNALFLLAFFAYVFAAHWWPLVAALILVSLFLIETRLLITKLPTKQYRVLRALLTIIAGSSMLVVHLAH